MKPFRRVRPGQTSSAPRIDADTGRLVVKTLERKPLMPNEAHESQAPFSAFIPMRARVTHPIQEARILKFWKLACLCRSHFLIPR
jgi:hypothetical protein